MERIHIGITATRKRKYDCIGICRPFFCFWIIPLFVSITPFKRSINSDKSQHGIVPKSYIHLLECVLTSKNEYVVKRTSIVDEITTVLSEWGVLCKRFYLTKHEIFQPIRQKISELIRLRSQILSGNLPVDEMKEVKLQATSEIDTGNKLLGKC